MLTPCAGVKAVRFKLLAPRIETLLRFTLVHALLVCIERSGMTSEVKSSRMEGMGM